LEKFRHIQKIKDVYAQGGNIIQYLRGLDNQEGNTIEDILISYDFQAGSYIQYYLKNREFKDNYGKALAKVIDQIGGAGSIIEVGVGEAITLNSVISNLKRRPTQIFGFDISWSRLKFAQEFLKENNILDVNLFTANLFEIPLLDNCIDIVYTSHSIEPNGGKEEEALRELYRITGKYMVLLEPSFEFASREEKEIMKSKGYVTELLATAKKLNYKIIEHRPFEYSVNPKNPTGLIIIEKQTSENSKPELVCPVSHTDLTSYNENLLYSKDSFLAYPVIDGIPCLLKDNAVLATHLLTDGSSK
jgi:ubiquinone/menaquinone biosynthesis C-methylase UbiE/uncharacterized protein YbaR (Trm112 family)